MKFQRRYRHFLRPCKQAIYPTCIVAVEATGEKCLAHDESYVQNSASMSWTASTATFNQGIHRRTTHASGDNSRDWWSYLDSVLRYNTNLWVASWNTPRTVFQLGLWEEMEARKAYLTGNDPRNSDASNTGQRHKWQGYAVLQNPPTILCFKRRDLPGTVTWIDMKNFGLSGLTSTDGDYTYPRAILGILIDIMYWIQGKNLGSVRATTGSQALHSWKYRFLTHTIHVNTDDTQNNLARDSLYGGRNECYRIGRVSGQIIQYDVNSLYPSIYAQHGVPVRMRELCVGPRQDRIHSALRGRNCIARIRVDTDIPNCPKRDNRGLFFPIGRYYTVVAWPELEIILDTAKSVSITEIATYDIEQALSGFAEELYAERTRAKSYGNVALASYIKSLLVSLPGKFAQRQKRWQISEDQTCAEPWSTFYRRKPSGGIQMCRSLAWTVEEEIDDGYATESVPEIAAWVNSWGRRILWEMMCDAGRKNVVYCDTDGYWMLTRACKPTRGLSACNSSEMGAIRKVGECKSIEIRGQKHYIADGVTTCAGAGSAYDMFGRWMRDINPSDRIKPYTIGNVASDGTVTPIELNEW